MYAEGHDIRRCVRLPLISGSNPWVARKVERSVCMRKVWVSALPSATYSVIVTFWQGKVQLGMPGNHCIAAVAFS